MSRAFVVMRRIEMVDGGATVALVTGHSDESTAQRRAQELDQKLKILASAALVVPSAQGPKSIGQAANFLGTLGISNVAFAVAEMEVQGSIEVPSPRITIARG